MTGVEFALQLNTAVVDNHKTQKNHERNRGHRQYEVAALKITWATQRSGCDEIMDTDTARRGGEGRGGGWGEGRVWKFHGLG